MSTSIQAATTPSAAPSAAPAVAMPTAACQPALAPWLDRCATLSPEYGAGLSTHLPMALHALQALGAHQQRLAALFERVAPRIPARAPDPVVGRAALPDALGRFDQFEALHRGVAARLRRDGLDALLRQELPPLMPGVAAVAFHGLIRTAHGVAAGHAGEVVAGLAYWASRHMPLLADGPPPAPGTLALPAWLDGLAALPAPADPPARLITGRMLAWSAVPGFADAAAALHLQPATLDDLTRQIARLYADSGNFTLLHGLTAGHALGVLRPWLGDDAAAMRQFTVALAAALRASGWPALPTLAPPEPALPWPDIVARAIASDDEHVIKLVHAARTLWTSAGDELFLAAARRAIHPDTPA